MRLSIPTFERILPPSCIWRFGKWEEVEVDPTDVRGWSFRWGKWRLKLQRVNDAVEGWELKSRKWKLVVGVMRKFSVPSFRISTGWHIFYVDRLDCD